MTDNTLILYSFVTNLFLRGCTTFFLKIITVLFYQLVSLLNIMRSIDVCHQDAAMSRLITNRQHVVAPEHICYAGIFETVKFITFRKI